ncbi:hypothetical protein BDY21DRAFT_312453 [Lineolata rhizophorae]|uniref:Potassium channel tetramerisation-type BTB domain-containing protein n=1 Tax=Lineolata rhizophorae TaxID=578093 RepID=A0A6A6PD81_9PEZI|nr:hypothetical protein BDY21DRAFT_312453 [Lineolata rhizophorae]
MDAGGARSPGADAAAAAGGAGEGGGAAATAAAAGVPGRSSSASASGNGGSNGGGGGAAARRAASSDAVGERGGGGGSGGGSGQAVGGKTSGIGKPRRIPEVPGTTNVSSVLPAGKVFPIQIGSELFRLSGASISSDAPSYFTHFFGEQLYNSSGSAGNVRTLYIDRDPVTFKDISLHLQGYHVKPRDGEHYVRLFADAQFYSLPRLTHQLFNSEIFIQIGAKDFKIPRELFSGAGDSPNFFSLGFAHFFTTPSDIFPGLNRESLLRPPSLPPPVVPNRSGAVFADLLRLLQGYTVHIRDETHRADLLRDARYFHLKGLEQRLLPCAPGFNLARGRREITIRLEDIRQSGVSFVADPPGAGGHSSGSAAHTPAASKPATPVSTASVPVHQTPFGAQSYHPGWVHYARPFVDDAAAELVVEIGGESIATVDSAPHRATFVGATKARVTSLFQVVANKLNLPVTQPLGLMMMQSGGAGGIAAQPVSPANSGVSGDKVKVGVGPDAFVVLDGEEMEFGGGGGVTGAAGLSQRGRGGGAGAGEDGADARDGEEGGGDGGAKAAAGKRRAGRWDDGDQEWVVSKGQWRLRVRPVDPELGRMEVVLHAVRVEAFTSEKERNRKRAFLG